MGKHIRIGTIVGAVLLVAIVALTIAYVGFGVFKGTNHFIIWLLLGWAVLIAVLSFVLYHRSSTREEIIRRFYLSDEGVFNYELGYASYDQAVDQNEAAQFVAFAVDSLASMSYGFETTEPPEDFTPKYVITTNTLLYHWPNNDKESVVVIDRWEGKLLRVVTPDDESSYETIGSFRNGRELASLLEKQDIFL